MFRIPVLTICLILLSIPAQAQSSRYSTWSNPDQPASAPPGAQTVATPANNTQLREFLEKLNKLVDEAEKARAADPQFLRDLRDLAKGVDRPQTKLVLNDDFSDGDFTRSPTWTTTRGAYFVERGWGLRNKVVATTATEPEPKRKLSNEEKAQQLFGAILSGKTNKSGGNSTASTTGGPQPTDIHVPAAVSNAFAVEVDVYSVLSPGTFAVTVYQGANRGAGYRLVYVAGKGIEIQRYTSRGTSVVDATRTTISLEDKKFHRLDWTRNTEGRMTVSIDDKQVLTTSDRSFRDPFSGLELSTRGGDFIVKRVALSGKR